MPEAMTGLLLTLLGAEMDDAVHIATTSLAFRGGIGLGWFVLLLLGLGAVFFWLYRNSPPNVSSFRVFSAHSRGMCAIVALFSNFAIAIFCGNSHRFALTS